ncbi:MAG: hypothetical protein WA197_14350 [Candidatus Acidiferrales bacterium]
MSYDLMVFDADAAPHVRDQFLDWYKQQTQWSEGHGYNDPAVPTAKLRSWFLDVIRLFPPLNGPLAQDDAPEDEDSVTDYSLGRFVIYCSFSWSRTEQAHKAVFELAEKHGVGFFDVSSNDSGLRLPKDGVLRLENSK